jgi:hypothetical protein
MSTAAIPKPAHATKNPAKYDRVFYSTTAIIAALTVLIGFGPTYYTKLFGSAPMHTVSHSPFSWVTHIHGALFSSWVVLFIAQTALIAQHKVKMHRTLGAIGGFLAGAMLVAGLTLAIRTMKLGIAPPGLSPLQFFAIPFFDMLLFAVFVAAAIWNRNNKETHKRLMLLGYISILAAAVARWPGVLSMGPIGFYGFTFIFLVAAVAYDVFSRRTVHSVYRWGGTFLVLSVPARLALSGTQAWQSFAGMLARM